MWVVVGIIVLFFALSGIFGDKRPAAAPGRAAPQEGGTEEEFLASVVACMPIAIHCALIDGNLDNRELATAAVWNVLSRPPEPRELQVLADYLDKRSDRPTEAVRQVVWSLLTSTEFRFNH